MLPQYVCTLLPPYFKQQHIYVLPLLTPVEKVFARVGVRIFQTRKQPDMQSLGKCPACANLQGEGWGRGVANSLSRLMKLNAINGEYFFFLLSELHEALLNSSSL